MTYNAYDELAPYYDAWQDGLRDPNDWAALALALYDETVGTDGEPLKILDFGCGSGSVARALAERGHFVTGVDLSEGMISLANLQHSGAAHLHFVAGDLNQVDPENLSPVSLFSPELGEGYDLIIGYLETFNHFPDLESLEQIFQTLQKFLAPHGLLFFDVLRENYILDVLPDLAFGEVLDDTDSIYLIWENKTLFDPLRNRAKLTFFKEEAADLYRRIPRVVEERYYAADELQAALASAALELTAEVDPLALIPLEEDSFYSTDRHFYLARRVS